MNLRRTIAAAAVAAVGVLPLTGCLPTTTTTLHFKEGLRVAGSSSKFTVRYGQVDVRVDRIHDPNSGTWQALAGVHITRDDNGQQIDRAASTVSLEGRDAFTGETRWVRTCTFDDPSCLLGDPDEVHATVLHWEPHGVQVELWSKSGRCTFHAWSLADPRNPVERRC